MTLKTDFNELLAEYIKDLGKITIKPILPGVLDWSDMPELKERKPEEKKASPIKKAVEKPKSVSEIEAETKAAIELYRRLRALP